MTATEDYITLADVDTCEQAIKDLEEVQGRAKNMLYMIRCRNGHPEPSDEYYVAHRNDFAQVIDRLARAFPLPLADEIA